MSTRRPSGKSSPAAVALSAQLCALVGIEPRADDLPYINAAAVAKEAARRSVDDPTSLQPLLDLAEEILEGPDHELGGLIVVGLFEDLQNYLLRGEGSTEAVLARLGPRSRRGWSAVEEAWAGDLNAIDRFFETE